MIRATLFVAHPDDELIFGHDVMLYVPNWEWTWVVATGNEHDRRGIAMAEAAEMMRAKGVNVRSIRFLNLEDATLIPRDDWFEDLIVQLLKHAPLAEIVFTHNRRGDYGHPHHCAVNAAAHWFYENVWEFLPHKSVSPVGPQWSGTTTRAMLARNETAKAATLQAVYPSQMKAIESDRPTLYKWATEGVESFTCTEGEWPTS